jgi:hypothetical protein
VVAKRYYKESTLHAICNQHFLITILIFKGYERVNPKHTRTMTTFVFLKRKKTTTTHVSGKERRQPQNTYKADGDFTNRCSLVQ